MTMEIKLKIHSKKVAKTEMHEKLSKQLMDVGDFLMARYDKKSCQASISLPTADEPNFILTFQLD